MKANYDIEAGDVRVIRPFIYVREAQTRDFSVGCRLPVINENCPACFEQPKVVFLFQCDVRSLVSASGEGPSQAAARPGGVHDPRSVL